MKKFTRKIESISHHVRTIIICNHKMVPNKNIFYAYYSIYGEMNVLLSRPCICMKYFGEKFMHCEQELE